MSFLPGFDPPPIVPQPTAEDDDWFTPQWLLDWLPPISLDPCWSPKSNVKAAKTFDLRRGENGMAEPWFCSAADVRCPECGLPAPGRFVFVNCPYSDCAAWVAKCAANRTQLVIAALIPAKPGEIYWHEHIWPHAIAVGFIRGRVAFDTANGLGTGPGVFTSALVVWGPAKAAADAVRHIQNRAHGHKQVPVWVKVVK